MWQSDTRKLPLKGFDGIELVRKRSGFFRPLVAQDTLGCGFNQIA